MKTSKFANGQFPLFDAAMIAAYLDLDGIKSAVARGYDALARGKAVQPPQTLVPLPEDRGDFIIYSAADFDTSLIGVKVSPYLINRLEKFGDPVTAYTLLISLASGEPVALCDSLALTAHRTAATTSLALDHLAGTRTDTLAVLGSGPLARLHVQYELLARPWRSVKVYSPSLAADHGRLEAWGGFLPLDRITVAADAREAVAAADVVMMCTSSGKPVIDTDWLGNDVALTSIGTNAFMAHEIEPAVLGAFQVFCDLRSTAPFQAGEMIIAARDHGWGHEAIVADLPELVSGKQQGTRSGRRFFRTTGLGIADISVAAFVTERIQANPQV